MAHSKGSGPGAILRALRTERGLTLRDLSKLVDMPYSTLSKLETGKMALTYDKMVSLAQGLQTDVSSLLAPLSDENEAPAATGRRSVARDDRLETAPSDRYLHKYIAQDLLSKKMSPIIIDVMARSVEELGGLLRHAGEEYLYIITGTMELHTDLYAPLSLSTGDSVYFDSGMAHGYIRIGDEPCRVLAVCTGASVQQLAQSIREHGDRQEP